MRAKIHTIGGLSAHADQAALIAWLRGIRREPEHTFLVHGERSTREIFADTLRSQLGWTGLTLPEIGDTFDA